MSRPRFLVDECLSVELPSLAWESDFAAGHLRDIGLLGRTDRALLALAEDWYFVTPNARDFRGPAAASAGGGAYTSVDVHAGLVCLDGDEPFDIERQMQTFAAALARIRSLPGCDTTNLLIEVTWRNAPEPGLLVELLNFPPV